MQFLKLVSMSLVLLINSFNVKADDKDYSAEEIIMKMEIALKEILKTEPDLLNYMPENILSNAEYEKPMRDKEYIELLKQYKPFEYCLPFTLLDKD